MTSYIGIDVSKKSRYLYLPVHNKSLKVSNNQQGFARLLSYCIKYYKDLSNIIAVFEPTGGYERGLREFLKANALNFTTSHPNKVRA